MDPRRWYRGNNGAIGSQIGESRRSNTMTTFVLIPGAGGEAWYWHRLVPELEARGHTAIAVDLPAGDETAGWAEYAGAIEAAIGDDGRGELVLVAQSLAGFSAPLVGERRRVDLLVLLNAMIPLPGETGEAWWSNTGQQEAEQAYFAEIDLPPDSAKDDRVVYFHDVPDVVVKEAYARGEPKQAWFPMTQPFPLERWPDVPTRVLAGRDDRMFPAEFQQRVARERLGLEADVIDGGHLIALSQQGELADRLERYRSEL
jgi:pimeloyl-ACP methyl ester carboxylesterase